MTNNSGNTPLRPETSLVVSGREPETHFGFVNTPIYHGSTVLFPDLATLKTRNQRYQYGRRGSPTLDTLETALTTLEGGAGTVLSPSGLSAITTAILTTCKAGDHLLVTDSVYKPTREFCDTLGRRLGIETTYYDPLIGAGISDLFRPNTAAVFTESPGSQTFEIQDIPAITAAAKRHDIAVIMDNTWATALFFRPLDHGVDLCVQAGTKYVVGHSDAMLGAVTANAEWWLKLRETHDFMGLCAGPEVVNLGQRGLRTMAVRLKQHETAAIDMARWLEARPEVARVLHPALESHPQHNLWKRDFGGSSGLFSIELKPGPEKALAALLDDLALFGMGYSWGGYESLVVPFDCRTYRTATEWSSPGPMLRFHIGLEHPDDLKADLDAGFGRWRAAGGG